jgi:hypothetical protein
MIVLTHVTGGLAPSLAFRFVSFLLILLLCCFERVVAEVDSEFKSVSLLFYGVFSSMIVAASQRETGQRS